MQHLHACPRCAATITAEFRFCPWCAAPQRRKMTEVYPGHPGLEGGAGRALRVSRYLAGEQPHTRLSVWSPAGVAEAVIPLDDAQTRRLARFLLEEGDEAPTLVVEAAAEPAAERPDTA